MNTTTGGAMVAIGTSMTSINNGIAELIILLNHHITNGAGDMTQEQGFMLAGLISPFVAMIYARAGVDVQSPPSTSGPQGPAPAAVVAIALMCLLGGASMLFGHQLRS